MEEELGESLGRCALLAADADDADKAEGNSFSDLEDDVLAFILSFFPRPTSRLVFASADACANSATMTIRFGIPCVKGGSEVPQIFASGVLADEYHPKLFILFYPTLRIWWDSGGE